ncbi:hypothetical protein EDD21DRAFT_204038 [Dissophora ornata]|nr:hypothetical protein EDD21DRAFT_204038 [Dissophora ornata]
MVSEYNTLARYLPQEIVNATMHMYDPLPPPGSRNVYEERFEAQRRDGGLMGGARDAAQSVLEEVVRRFRAGALPGLGGGADGAGELQEEQLRQIADAVRFLRGHQAQEHLPGAFPGQAPAPRAEGAAAVNGQDADVGEQNDTVLDTDTEALLAAETAGNPSMFQSLTEMMRLLGFGTRAGAADGAGAVPALTQEETNELIAAMTHNVGPEDLDFEGEEDEEEEYTDDEDQPFGPEGDDGWEPYDPAAFE